MNHSRLYRGVLTSGLVATIALVAFACSGGDDETATPASDDVAPDAGATVAGPGTLIFEGVRFEPPFDVTSNGRSISVNGTTVMTLGGIVPEAPDLDAPIESAFGLADHAAEAYAAAGGGAGALEAARDAIANEPLLASAIVDADANELAITDTSGLEVFFIPEPPDGAARARSDSELEAEMAGRAASWSATLRDGGLIVVPTAGPTLTVGGAAAAELVGEIDTAMGLAADEREARLLELLTHDALVSELIANYEPAAESRRLSAGPALARTIETTGGVTSVAAPRQQSISFNSRGNGQPSVVTQAAATISQTPGKPEAYVFATLFDADSAPFVAVMAAEGYQVWVYDSEDRTFNGSGYANFLATSGTGALYLATHGSPRGVSVESFASQRRAAQINQQLSGPEAGNFYWWRATDGTWWLGITIQGLQRRWQSNNTIVHAAICTSNTLNAGFRAREYFGYQPTTTCTIATPDTTLLWQRMSGQQGEGKFRPASVAFAQGGFSAGFRYVDGSVNEDTVVSPGIVEFLAPTLAIGEEGIIVITFDAILDQSVPAQSLVRVMGCALPTAEATYALVGNFGSPAPGITIPVKANEVGTGSVTVIAANTRSPGKIHLDGNQKPANSNHVAENRDDYVGAVACTNSGIQPPTATPGIQPPTATPGGTPDPTEPPEIEIPDPSTGATRSEAGVTPPAGKLLVFYLDGTFYDGRGLATIDAHIPFCFYDHVHGGPIEPVLPPGGPQGTEYLGECGYGPPNFYLIDIPS